MNNNQETSSKQNDLILIRHAQSEFNLGFQNYIQSNNIQFTPEAWQYCLGLNDFNQTVTYSKQFIDPSLTQLGHQQCKKVKQKLKDEHIDLVLVSPYERALKTCHQIFGDSKVKVQVVPLLGQAFRYSCDINHDIKQKIQKYHKYDFNQMQGLSELWFFHHLKDHHFNTYQQYLKSQQKCQEYLTLQEKHDIVLQLVKSKKIEQVSHQLRQRSWKIKQLLAEYKKKYKKIAIVSHFHILVYLLATSFNEHSQSNVLFVSNATPIYKNLEDIMMIK